jgi:hypothetical protein
MTVTRQSNGEVSIFVVSYARPQYLWTTLDCLYRYTRTPARILLVDNWHPDRQVDTVIDAFERRGLLRDVHRFTTNTASNITSAYNRFLREAGPYHVVMESDAAIQSEGHDCWLAEMGRIFSANPQIGMLGSLIDTRDFVSPLECAVMAKRYGHDTAFLAKSNSPERAFLSDPSWSDTRRGYFYTEPPCPIPNPPGRLLMLGTDMMKEVGLLPDAQLATLLRKRGLRPAVTPRVRHRHLSLLNVFDYPHYSEQERNGFFSALAKRQVERPAPQS